MGENFGPVVVGVFRAERNGFSEFSWANKMPPRSSFPSPDRVVLASPDHE
jgi:hypothetical protein